MHYVYAKILIVELKLPKFLNSTILASYLALVIVTPLLFSTHNTELFEVPKMLFVYFFAAVILTLTKIKFILEKKKSIPFDLVTVSFAAFVLVQVASTITSIDKFTSIFGYPSRLNGGLASQFAYFVIFTCALINLTRENVKKIAVAAVLSATAVALWGIPAHFGKDPNCLVLTGSLTSTCWQQEFDPTRRIFSTLGQPNWLASYLVLILPLAISQIFVTKNAQKKIMFAAITLVIFTAAIFTNSRGGAVGAVIAILTFTALLGTKKIQKNFKVFLALAAPIIIAALVFGSTLISRINEIVSPQDSPGTESSKIRLIVWQGAMDIAKAHPLLGTGPETFAYSYYKLRPAAHNLTTEWNFFYNKAHNEFLNYAANVGLLGLGSNLVFLSVALYSIWKVTRNSKDQSTELYSSAVFSAVIGYQTTIFFGFSVVTTQLLMFLLIAFVLIQADQTKFKVVNLAILKNRFLAFVSVVAVAVIGLYLTAFVLRLLAADIMISRAKNTSLQPETLLTFTNVLTISPVKNPYYLADTAVALATYGANSQDEKTRRSLTEQSKKLAKSALDISPQNIIVIRRIANAYILISGIDQTFYGKTADIGELIATLAPTDPQSYLTLAKIQIAIEQNEDAKNSLQKALDLKPDYQEAKLLLKQLTNNN